MQARRFVLIRHGEAGCNTCGPDDEARAYDPALPLTPLGRRQARRLARHYAGRFRPCVIWASPLPRAVETASYLAAAEGVPVRRDDRLAEIRVLGRPNPPLRTREWDDLLEERLRDPDREISGVESVRAHYERVAGFLDEIIGDGDLRDRHVILVTHAWTIQMALCYFMGHDLGRLRRLRWHVGQTGVFIVDYCHETGVTTLVAANSRAHLGRY